jgi:UDP-hydrolysing UDP-N-acetyl-D-glucosamine 2-epimerase
MTKNIVYISGTRADYGLMRSVLRALDQSPDFDLEVVATGMHLMPEFGNSVSEILADGFRHHKIPVIFENDTRESMSLFIGKFVTSLTEKIMKIQPDLILLLGDRGEMLAGAIVGTYLGIPIAHIHGGEITSTVDEPTRHAITKLAHIHLPATEKSAQRIIRMEEDPATVHVVGAPGLEAILKGEFTPIETLLKKYHLDSSIPFLLVIQHPVSDEIRKSAIQMKTTLDVISGYACQTLIIYPNADAGGRQMIPVINKYCKSPNFQAHKNLPHADYLGLMRITSVLVGNSSSGIVEAPSFHVPVVNIGSRQQGRERAVNVLNAGYDRTEITNAINKALHDRRFLSRVRRCENPYNHGSASENILQIFRQIDLSAIRTQKHNFY